MTRSTRLLFSLLLLVVKLAAQPAEPKKLPEDFTVASETRVTKLLEQPGLSATDRNFIIRSNFLLDRLLWSGQVLTGDEMSRYAGRVADRLLFDDPELRKQIHIYTISSTDANAWTFGRGVILVTTGLYARIQNEAQLAFILAHEIAHFKKKHALNTFALQSCADLQSCSAPVQLQRINVYSRENELEADREGVNIMRHTQYDLRVIPGVFDLLEYSYLPPEEVKFQKTFFEDSALVFPKQFFLGLLNEIVRREDLNDTNSTHPSARKRRLTTQLLVANVDSSRLLFYEPAGGAFLSMKHSAAIALCRLYLGQGAYREALYNAQAFLSKFPLDWELQTCIGQALYGIALVHSTTAKTDGSGSDYSRYMQVQGQLEQVYYFVSQLSSEEAAVLALHYNWKRHMLQPTNPVYANQSDSLLALVTGFYKLQRRDFYLTPPPPDKPQADDGADVRGEVQTYKPSYEFYRYALGQLFRDSMFAQTFRYYEERASRGSFADLVLQHPQVKSVLLVDPFVRVTDSRDPSREFFFAGSALHKKQTELAKAAAKANGINMGVLDVSTENYPGEKLDFITAVTNWVSERMAVGASFFPPAGSAPAMNPLLAQSRYMLLMGVVNTGRFRSEDLSDPHPHHRPRGVPRTTCYALLFDLKTGQMILNARMSKKRRLTDKLMQNWMADLFAEIAALK